MSEAVKEAEKTAEAPKTEAVPSEFKPLLDSMHRLLLAGIGAVVLAQEEVEELVGKLVERGEIAEADARKMIKDTVERRRKQVTEEAKKTEDVFDQRVEDILARMNVPTKDEVEALSAKITALTKKVDELKKVA
jgi:poly(hydroxyalkanoate) granule-associated protein